MIALGTRRTITKNALQEEIMDQKLSKYFYPMPTLQHNLMSAFQALRLWWFVPQEEEQVG